MPNPHNLKVGDVLWCFPSNHRGGHDDLISLPVRLVGNKYGHVEWKHFGIERVDLVTLHRFVGDGYKEQCYLTREGAEEAVARKAAWAALAELLRPFGSVARPDLSSRQLRHIEAILKGEV